MNADKIKKDKLMNSQKVITPVKTGVTQSHMNVYF